MKLKCTMQTYTEASTFHNCVARPAIARPDHTPTHKNLRGCTVTNLAHGGVAPGVHIAGFVEHEHMIVAARDLCDFLQVECENMPPQANESDAVVGVAFGQGRALETPLKIR